jgi:hypothetical protein
MPQGADLDGNTSPSQSLLQLDQGKIRLGFDPRRG